MSCLGAKYLLFILLLINNSAMHYVNLFLCHPGNAKEIKKETTWKPFGKN